MTATQKQIDYINTLLETRISNAQARVEKPQFAGVYWQQMEEIGLRLVSAIAVSNDLTKDQASKLIDALKVGKFSATSIENAATQWGRAYRGDIEWPARLENIIQAGTALYGAAWGEIAQQYMDILLNSSEPDQRSAAVDAWLHPAETPASTSEPTVKTESTSKIDTLFAAREQLQMVVNSILVRVPFDDVGARYPMAETRIRAAITMLQGVHVGAMQRGLTNTLTGLTELTADMHIDSKTLADALADHVSDLRNIGQTLFLAVQGVDAFGNSIDWSDDVFDAHSDERDEAEYV